MRDDLNSGGLMGKLTGYFQAVVRGGIVDDEDPYIVDAFLQDALDAAAKKATGTDNRELLCRCLP